ncbi:MAG: hypothetical protein ACK6AO_07790, partial [Planctomycetota bacterium]
WYVAVPCQQVLCPVMSSKGNVECVHLCLLGQNTQSHDSLGDLRNLWCDGKSWNAIERCKTLF